MMTFSRFKRFFRRRNRNGNEISPDEIFLDSENLPQFDRDQFEGRIEKPISKGSMFAVASVFLIIAALVVGKLWMLEVKAGKVYAARSETNRLDRTVVFSDRGTISDRNGVPLAWNVASSSEDDFALRQYASIPGISNLIGYIKYPSKDSSGIYYREDFIGMDGIEKYFNTKLQGENGEKLVETDAKGKVESQGVLHPPKAGENLTLTIDSKIQTALYNFIKELADKTPFEGGAAVIMDVKSGEVIAQVNYPEYESQVLTDGVDSQKIKETLQNKNNPFLDRVADGLYTPGSIIKPFIALAALNEKVISPTTQIFGTAYISIPNPYFPDQPTIFKDWRAQGYVDMRRAIAVSSDVYFYEVGGGYQGQKGLGIDNIKKYAQMFGFGTDITAPFFEGSKGVIPDPAWKAANFNGEKWNIGDTYHTAIGQYGFQVTPIQVARAYAALATNGVMPQPRILLNGDAAPLPPTKIDLPKSFFDVVHDGMYSSVHDGGTAAALDVPYVSVSGKTGTAELGVTKDFVNSWTTGFFPSENPRYAYAVIMEHGPRTNLIGASAIMREMLDWMHINTPGYLNPK